VERAEGIALRSATALEATGLRVTVASLVRIDPEQLRHHQRMLLVASSFGDRGPPDAGRRFAQRLVHVGGDALSHAPALRAAGIGRSPLHTFFGHALDHALVAAGAKSLFPMVEVDDGDRAALAHWRRHLVALGAPRGDAAGTTFLNAEADTSDLASAPFHGCW
jgi:sulfite reductase (NADPH) flavoprotein alpha-component